MVTYFSADFIVPVFKEELPNGVIGVDQSGTIVELYSSSHVPKGIKINKLKGVLIPGFINAHCHIELSHMENQIAKHTGLTNFIHDVITKREEKVSLQQTAMKEADRAMYNAGIQAVSDHVNSSVSVEVKKNSKIVYHTVVEIISMSKDQAQEKIMQARDIEFEFGQKHVSISPHAPYSCSKDLFKVFKKSVDNKNIISIHNQESDEENKLYRYRQGEFLEFYKKMNINVEDFKAQARNSIQSYLPALPANNPTILVHNTFSSSKDLDFIKRMNHNTYLCLCPKSNLFIENTLPKVNSMLQQNIPIIIGTDSLASNDTLSILEELKVLHANFPELSFTTSIKWATLNGAQALGLSDKLGSLEIGKAPGLILLKNLNGLKMTEDADVERIV